MSEPATGSAPEPEVSQRYRHLPERVPLDELITETPSSDATDPEMGRDPDRDWLLRGS
jgi:hypothetical protein